MKLLLLTVGKEHESYVKEGIQLFTKRIGFYFPCEWMFIPATKPGEKPDTAVYRWDESDKILSRLQPDDTVILLDERGKNISSIQLADLLQSKANQGIKRLVFVIGGAFGVDAILYKRAQFVWSLSNLVFPHQLVRLLLSEQVYRACTIIRNEKYHHT
ncbi:MAG: 23S rRNA (pseudouridine(1915)-N(3))-methyltransferase RlmH [Ferruginibacter sp.]